MGDQQWSQPEPSNFTGAAASSDGWNNPAEYESGTDTDTSSDDGNATFTCEDLPATSSEAELLAEVYWAYSKAKGRWRRMTGKPVRKVRRFLRKRPFNSSFGKGKGKNRFTFLADESDENLETIFKGKGGKGSKGRRTSGKGFGRKTNPRDKQGNIMTCHRCGSTEHLIRDCPMPKGSGKGFG